MGCLHSGRGKSCPLHPTHKGELSANRQCIGWNELLISLTAAVKLQKGQSIFLCLYKCEFCYIANPLGKPTVVSVQLCEVALQLHMY